MIPETVEQCPYCGASNNSIKRTADGTPKTIAELAKWYEDRHLPPYEITRFFIGIDYRQPRAFGIYQDENEFIVYKNKADGTRAVRYQGTDEAYAVNELYLKLKDEILNQKAHQQNHTNEDFAQETKKMFSDTFSSKNVNEYIIKPSIAMVIGIVMFIVLIIVGFALNDTYKGIGWDLLISGIAGIVGAFFLTDFIENHKRFKPFGMYAAWLKKPKGSALRHAMHYFITVLLIALVLIIGFIVWNENQHPNDYNNLKNVYRPSHADYTYTVKYGIRDHRGGGRSSARETISRVVAGALAKLALRQLGVNITAYTSQVGPIKLEGTYSDYNFDLIETNDVRCPDPEKAKEMADLIYKVKGEGDTIGGTLTCVIKGCPIGLGQPVFGKLHAALGNAMLSINAAKAFEYGEGFKGLKMKGSEQNDVFYNNNGRIETHTNHSGGIQGGLSNGQDIYFRVVFKPIATLLMEQETVNIDGVDTTLKARGRHDACVLPRAVPIVEAMAAMTILDYYLLDKTTQL